VGALCARAAVRGAWLNVRTNLAALEDRTPFADLPSEGERLLALAAQREAAVLDAVERAARSA
jgi:glutamate formiminotransferase/formiminotetrahydrofolate cyclodeaminase